MKTWEKLGFVQHFKTGECIQQYLLGVFSSMFINIIVGDENKPDQCIFYFLRFKPQKNSNWKEGNKIE